MEKQFKPVPDVECLKYHGTADKPDIKIFVSHRIDLDSETIDNPLYIPVRCGAVYDEREGVTMLGDDTGDNISEKRLNYCELTVQYWAWKNIEADYYGLCHYRRYFSFSTKRHPAEVQLHEQVAENLISLKTIKEYGLGDYEAISNEIAEYDMILPEKWNVKKFAGPNGYSKSVYAMWKSHEMLLIGKNSLDITIAIIKEKFPQYYEAAKEYFAGNKVQGFNCFIMRKHYFQKLCEFEFSVLEELEKQLDTSYYGVELSRTFGFIGESLVAIFVYHCCKESHCKVAYKQLVMFQDTSRQKEIIPQWGNEVPIVVTSSDYYIPYLSVFLESLSRTSDPIRKYHVIVLNKNISANNQRRIQCQCISYSNICVQFYNPKYDLDGFVFYTANAVEESNYRMLAPWILKNHKKAIVIDIDIIFCDDIALLYDSTQFGPNEWIAASRDIVYQGMLNGVVSDTFEYTTKIMKMQHPYNYVNTGVMVFNLEALRKNCSKDDLLSFSSKNHFRIQEQDIINVYFEDKIKELDLRWNYYIETNSWITHCINYAPAQSGRDYQRAKRNPHLFHFANIPKPWDDPSSVNAQAFWDTAKGTPFYEVIIARLIEHCIDAKTGILHGAVYDLQCRAGIFDTRSGARKLADKLLPKGSHRREFAKFLLPKGSLRWRFCKQIYYIFKPQYRPAK